MVHCVLCNWLGNDPGQGGGRSQSLSLHSKPTMSSTEIQRTALEQIK